MPNFWCIFYLGWIWGIDDNLKIGKAFVGLTDFFVFFIVVLGVLDRFACQGSFVVVRPRWGRGGGE